MEQIENGMVSGSAHYGAPFDEPLSPSDIAYIYGDRDTEKTAPVATERPTGKTINDIIPVNQPLIKNDLKRLRVERHILPSALVETVRTNYPRFDVNLYAKCERTEEYGITLCAGAMGDVMAVYAPDRQFKAPAPDAHRLPCRMSCRLSKADYRLIQAIMMDKGFETAQAFLAWVLHGYIKRHHQRVNRTLKV